MELDILRLGLDKEPLSADLNSQEIERRQQLEIERQPTRTTITRVNDAAFQVESYDCAEFGA